MNDVVYITGHRNPDTDSICSAVSYAEFKNKMGVNAIPIRLGEVSRETQFVLDYFGVKAPKLVETVKTQIADLDIDGVTPIAPETSLKTAWSMIRKNNVKTVPVVDDEDKLVGLASQSNLTSSYMDIWDTNVIEKSGTKLENIVDTLSAKCLYASEKNPKFTGKVVVAAMDAESAGEFIDKGDMVICGNREDAQNVALKCGASLIVVTGNHLVNDEILQKAKDCHCSVIITPYDTFTSARLIPQSIPVSHVMTKDNLVSFKTDDLIDDVREVMLQTRYRSYPVVNSENKIVGSISRYHLISESKKKVILVDHNEKAQSVHGLEDAEILEIIDHHKIGGVQTGSPIYFRNEPVGCTATIVASRFFENGIRPSKKIAGLLCAAIISDTLLFKSPTATNTDKLILERLASIADINPEKFATEMFIAGSSLEGKTPAQILNQDFKPFTMGDVKVGVGQISTMDTEGFEKVRKDVIELMEKTASSDGYGLVLLLVTDILKGGSELIAVGDHKDAVSRAFNVTLEGTSAYAPGVLSRKKQVIPPLTAAMTAQK
ncbi:putative manganese-dependent inorganic diphosphatase [Clostridium sp. CX1]|uniref:putative manganese-dependent inorganic diphosphatase n=1 Tax=Clostridium sp. CX1 TaxID=2978346 RepID=UPI0021C178B7|nr:putative manganese-dependent inorganic diphosphatase [Clostridium sp. CX1]MCT8976086.1 putative manganese-dependent inorganic diphosphatase [Clostridium sp. CX1]